MIDWGLIRDVLSWAAFLGGGAFVVIGAVGIVRFPDFFTRMHAAGITDTAGATLILTGMALQAPTWNVFIRLVFIAAFLLFTSPVATHAIAHAAWVVGLKPMLGPGLKREGEQ